MNKSGGGTYDGGRGAYWEGKGTLTVFLYSEKLPLQQSEPVVGHMVTLPRVSRETGRERGAVHFVLGGVQVGSIPSDVTGGRGGVLDHRRMECQVDVLPTQVHTAAD